ncbi:hypothetical protein ACXDI5_004662, partial [Klebsiella variicola]
MPEKVTSLNGLKVTLEYGTYRICQSSVEMSIRWLVRNVLMLKSLLSARSGHYVRMEKRGSAYGNPLRI